MPGAYSPPLGGTGRHSNARIFRLSNVDTAPMNHGGQLSDHFVPEDETPWTGTFIGWQNPRTRAYTLIAGITDDGFLMLDTRHRHEPGAGGMSKRKRYDLINQFLEGINAPFRLDLRNGTQIVTRPDGGVSIVERYNYHWMPTLMRTAGTQLGAQQSMEALSCSPNWVDGATRLANDYRAMQTVQIQGSAQHDMHLLFAPESNPIHHAVYQLILRTVGIRTYRDVVFNDLASVAGQASKYIVIHCNGRIGDSYATE